MGLLQVGSGTLTSGSVYMPGGETSLTYVTTAGLYVVELDFSSHTAGNIQFGMSTEVVAASGAYAIIERAYNMPYKFPLTWRTLPMPIVSSGYISLYVSATSSIGWKAFRTGLTADVAGVALGPLTTAGSDSVESSAGAGVYQAILSYETGTVYGPTRLHWEVGVTGASSTIYETVLTGTQQVAVTTPPIVCPSSSTLTFSVTCDDDGGSAGVVPHILVYKV